METPSFKSQTLELQISPTWENRTPDTERPISQSLLCVLLHAGGGSGTQWDEGLSGSKGLRGGSNRRGLGGTLRDHSELEVGSAGVTFRTSDLS